MGYRNKILSKFVLAVALLTGFFFLGDGHAKAQNSDFENIPAPDEKGPYDVGIMTFADVPMSPLDPTKPPSPTNPVRKTLIQIFYPTDPDPDLDLTNPCPDRYTIQIVPPPGIAGTYKRSSPLCAVQDATVAAGPFPLIVHDHGGDPAGNQRVRLEEHPVFETLASHGFVVAVALHSGNRVTQVRDLSLVIDYMLGLSPSGPPNPLSSGISGSIDPNRVGISGFSAGGLNARRVAGGWSNPGPGIPAIPADPRIKAMVLYEPEPNAATLATDAATISFPYLVMGGNRFNNALQIPELFDATVLATPRIYVLNPDAFHFSYFSGLCSLIEETREAALTAYPDLPEPLTNRIKDPAINPLTNTCFIDTATNDCRRVCNTNIIIDQDVVPDPDTRATIKAAAFDACFFWNRGEPGFSTLGFNIGGGRNFCTRIGTNPNSARSLDADGDGFTDSPPFLGNDDPFVSDDALTPIPSEIMVPMMKLYTVAFWNKFLAGDGRYMRYLTPGYAKTQGLPAVVEIRE